MYRDGSIRHWRIEPMFNKNYFFIKLLKIHANAHNSIVRSVSATSQYIASGSQRGSIKVRYNNCNTAKNKIRKL